MVSNACGALGFIQLCIMLLRLDLKGLKEMESPLWKLVVARK